MKKKMIFIAILLTIMSISVIYYNYTQTTKNIENNIKNEEILNQSYAKITINGEEILFFKHTPNDEPINLETLNIEYDTILNIETKDAEVKIGDKIIENIEYNIGKIKISNKNKIILHIKFLGEEEYKKYEINTLPSDFFQYELEGEPNENEEYYITFYDKVSSNSNYYIFKMNSKGEVTFFKKMSYYNNAFNFKKQIINDKTRYTYLETSNFEYEGLISSLPATLVVLNEKYEKINEIMYDKEKEIYADNHDYVYLDDNHYIICGYTKETVNNFPGSENKSIWNCRIKEVKDDKILWEFESVKNKELYEYSNEVYNSDNAFDYMRFNSMDIDPNDGNLICSFREIDAIIKISRTNGKIIWVLGGKGDQFGLTEEQKFSTQHSASMLKDNNILLYDNGFEDMNTRILKIKIDEKNKKIDEYFSYNIGSFFPMMGDVQAINEDKNTYLITYGMGAEDCAFEEINLKTSKSIFKFRILNGENVLYCVNKYKK